MKTNAKTGQTAERRILRRGITLALFLSLAFCGIPEAAAQKVRVAMPAKSMTFLNFYVGDKFGVYKAEGLDVSLEVIKTDVGVAGMVAGEIDYTTAIGSAMRAAATGVPIKATMFSMDRVLIYMFAKPSIKSIEELKGGKTVSTTGLLATPTSAAKVMARAHGLNPEKDLVSSPRATSPIRWRHCRAERPMWRCFRFLSTSRRRSWAFAISAAPSIISRLRSPESAPRTRRSRRIPPR